MTVLVVSHSEQSCGVWQFGNRFFDLASRSEKFEYMYAEPHSIQELVKITERINPEVIIYNWYPCTMSWLSEDWVSKQTKFKQLFIFHDGNVRQNYDGYLFNGAGEKDAHARRIVLDKATVLPRPLFDYTNTYEKNTVPHIGSFGLGGWHKGFPDLVTLVNNTFDEAILNIHMPSAIFGDKQGIEAKKIADMCRELNINPNIQLNLTHKLLSNEEVLDFLARNDLNVFLYHANNEGLSSVIDYALSVNRPIAITESMMFRHFSNAEIIVGENNSLIDIMNRGIAPIEKFYTRWSTDQFIKELDNAIESYINK